MRKLWLGLALGLVLLFILSVTLVPALAQIVLLRELETALQGQASLEEFELKLYRGSLGIRALKISDTETLRVRDGNLRLDLSLRALLLGDLDVTAELSNALVDYGDLVIKLERLYFDGSLVTDDEAEDTQWVVRGDLDIDALGLFDREREITLLSLGSARLQDAAFNTVTIAIFIPEMTLGQIGAVNTGSEESRWLYGEDITLTGLDYAGSLLQIETLQGSGVRSIAQLTAEGELVSQGVLSASLDALAGETDPAAEEETPFDFVIGRIEVEDSEVRFTDEQFKRPLKLDLQVAELVLAGIDSRAPQQAAEFVFEASVGDSGHIEVRGQITPLALDSALSLKGEISDLALELASPYSEHLLGYEITGGRLDGRFEARIEAEALNAEPAFELRDLAVAYHDLDLTLGALELEASVFGNLAADTPALQILADVSAEALGLGDRERGLTLLSLGSAQLAAAQINTAGPSVSLPELRLNALGAVETEGGESRWLYGETTVISDLLLVDKVLQIASIEASGARSSLLISPEGQLESQGVLSASLRALAEPAEAEAPPSPETDEGEAPFHILVERIDASDSELVFVDQQFRHPLILDLLVEEMSLTGLDSRQPEKAAALTFKSRVGEYSRIDLEGQLAPFAKQTTLDVAGKIHALDLPVVSPYFEQLLGYEFSAGQFDHSFDIKIAENTLDASNKVDLRGLKVTRLDDVEPTAPLPIPLDTGLDMLRDNSGHIALDVPLQGRLDDPEVGVGQIISKALAKGMTKGSTTFLKLALQPYGAIWMGAEMGLEMATRVRLDPMAFPPLHGELGPEQQDYAGKLGALLGERPGMNLTLCGIAGKEDHLALAGGSAPTPVAEEATSTVDLKALAQGRSSALKFFLVNEKQVDPTRLIVCKDTVDPESPISGIRLEI